jgi:hypothetical protein
MSKNHLIAFGKLCSLVAIAAGGLMMASCAEDGFDENERFESKVSNTQLVSPTEYTLTTSADGKSQTVVWPVVYGAGGYQVSLYDASNMEVALVDSLVEGCSVTFKREEDVNYVLKILTKGNAALGNTDASEASQFTFSTFTPTFQTIPAGSDLNQWFAANPIPEESIGENLNYDLEAGGEYTVSSELDFDAHWVTLRSNSKTNPATIKYTTAASCINFTAPFNVKYLKFDCTAMSESNGVFGFSKSPTAERVSENNGYAVSDFVIFKGNVTIVNSTFKGVNGYFFWDNRKDQKVAAVNFLIDNCLVELTPPASNSGGVIWTNKGGHINDLTVSNSTFYNLGAGDVKYFYQAGMYRAKDIGMGGSASSQSGKGNSVTYKNSTFYRIGWNNGQWGNYNGMQGKLDSFWTMTDCIFYDCSNGGSVPRRFLHGQAYANNPENKTFANNTYMKADGTFQDPQNYDTSGTVIEEDPQFANPEEGDFHISGATQVARRTGDPRWLPGAE